MKIILSRLAEAFPFLHSRSATEQDFHEYCRLHKVKVVFDSDVSTGIYVRFMGTDTIFLSPKLSGWMLRYVMFHELAHAIFHAPTQSNMQVDFFGVKTRNHRMRKNHLEAEAVAAVLLLPTLELHERLTDPEFVNSDELQELVAYRLKIYKKHRE